MKRNLILPAPGNGPQARRFTKKKLEEEDVTTLMKRRCWPGTVYLYRGGSLPKGASNREEERGVLREGYKSFQFLWREDGQATIPRRKKIKDSP